ncbi:MAG: trimethylamine methyltransferase family protein [Candidatus Neomarinimicrobiota bacterium]
MRPKINFLNNSLIEQIIEEAITILTELGVEIQNKTVIDLLSSHGAKVDSSKSRVYINQDLIDKALKTSPSAFKLFDIYGNETNDFSGLKIHFTPGSAALHILDYDTNHIRKPLTSDYIKFVKVVDQLNNIASQSTAMIPSDVNEQISDSYRLFLSLLYGKKPVITGTFTVDSFEVMKNMQLMVRGSAKQLKEKPLTVFSCCPTSPLKWSDVTSQNVIDCGVYGIPVEFIAMPLSGFMAPVTITGTLVQHTAETLSGVVISQLSSPGAPMLYGGSPAAFDIRYETTPMGAIETMMIDCAYNEIGKYLGIPTQAYISLSDAKHLDSQAGLESGIGATLAALSGINNISGPGMLDFESCQSLEKLIIDNEICGMTLRLTKGIEPKEDFPSLPHFKELLQEGHLLISDHTLKYLNDEHYLPGKVINRANLSRWKAEGEKKVNEIAHTEVQTLVSTYQPNTLSDGIKNELVQLMKSEAKKHGQDELPKRD